MTTGARVLILGTLPGVASLEAQAYYAHPRNTFWWIMSELLGFDAALPYEARSQRLADSGIAVWDVIANCVRPGSLDSSIRQETLVPNDFSAVFDMQPGLRCLAFNGQAARKLFRRHVEPQLGKSLEQKQLLVMPSTSPAFAAMSRENKKRQWAAILDYLA